MSTDVKRYYAVLRVDATASEEDIRSAFRRRAKELHPDAQSGNANAFILLKRAYDVLIDPERRAAYDRACQPPSRPAPRAHPNASRHQRRSRPPPPPPSLSRGTRRSGVSFVRYAIAFLIMAAISLGGVQAMIIWTEAPPSIQTRSPVARGEISVAPPSVAESPAAPGSSKTGFWDPTPPTVGKRTP